MSGSALVYTVESAKSFDDAVASVEAAAVDKGFRVLHTHDVAAVLTEKGFPRGPLKIVEVCNARYASEVLGKDIDLAVMLPCPISVYTEKGRTYIGTMFPKVIADLFPQSGVEAVTAEVERVVLEIIDQAK